MAFTSSKQWVLVGVTSYGRNCSDPHSAGVYTRVAAYQTWISSTTSGQGIHPSSSGLIPTTTDETSEVVFI